MSMGNYYWQWVSAPRLTIPSRIDAILRKAIAQADGTRPWFEETPENLRLLAEEEAILAHVEEEAAADESTLLIPEMTYPAPEPQGSYAATLGVTDAPVASNASIIGRSDLPGWLPECTGDVFCGISGHVVSTQAGEYHTW